MLQPGLRTANEVDDLHFRTKLFESWQVRVGGGGTHVVEKGKALGAVSCSPVTEVKVQKSLVSPVKASMD